MTKDRLVNDCLADAMIYQGKPRIDINERMQAAIVQAVNTTGGRPATAPDSPVVVITDSVGSKITFDAIYKLASVPGKGEEWPAWPSSTAPRWCSCAPTRCRSSHWPTSNSMAACRPSASMRAFPVIPSRR